MPVPPAALAPESTALIVVDAQNAFAHERSPLAEQGVDLSHAVDRVPRLQSLLEAARDAGYTIAFTRSIRRADGRDAPDRVFDVVPGIYRGDGDPICCAGDWNAEYLEQLRPADGEYEVAKHRYDGFHDTPLEFYLRSEGVRTVVIGGFATNVCVEGTARGAHERGFNVVVIEDCCAAFSLAEHEAAIRDVEAILGTSLPLDEFRDRLAAISSV